MTQIITVAGAGFSGLVTAYFLTKKGFRVHVAEKTDRPGGLIKTIRTEHGLVETAANGLLSSARLEEMCADIGVPLLPARREGRKRFIYRGRPRQLPLKPSELLSTLLQVTVQATDLKPRPLESIAAWGRRVLGGAATDYLLTPALGGIYAGDPEKLSASLIFGRAPFPDHLGTYRPAKGKLRGTVAPREGMQQLIDVLFEHLKKSGVEFDFDFEGKAEASDLTVVCLSARAASSCLVEAAPELSQALQAIEMLSLATVTTFYASDRYTDPGPAASEKPAYQAATLRGFGCLFPRDQNFRARGVLFNGSIFEGRGPAHAETWIFGGALDPDVVNLTDAEFAQLIATERERFYGVRNEPLAIHVTRWPRALPHYSVELERILTSLPPPPSNVTLVGNYLGKIGLAKILERAAFVADWHARR